jgi:hypothetical protein
MAPGGGEGQRADGGVRGDGLLRVYRSSSSVLPHSFGSVVR